MAAQLSLPPKFPLLPYFKFLVTHLQVPSEANVPSSSYHPDSKMQDNLNATYRMQKIISRDMNPSDMRIKKDEENLKAKSGKGTRDQNLISASLS